MTDPASLQPDPSDRIPMISVIDDDESVRRAVSRLIRSADLAVATYESAEDFMADESARRTDCLILDLHLPGRNGLELQSELAASGRQHPIVFITAFDDDSARNQAMNAGAADFLRKPIDSERLIDAVQAAISKA